MGFSVFSWTDRSVGKGGVGQSCFAQKRVYITSLDGLLETFESHKMEICKACRNANVFYANATHILCRQRSALWMRLLWRWMAWPWYRTTQNDKRLTHWNETLNDFPDRHRVQNSPPQHYSFPFIVYLIKSGKLSTFGFSRALHTNHHRRWRKHLRSVQKFMWSVIVVAY